MKTKRFLFLQNPYIQTILALLVSLLGILLLGNNLFRQNINNKTQFASIIGIAIIVFLFFSFSLWMVNRQKQWISKWANHPLWVILTFAIFPAFLVFFSNTTFFSNILPDELIVQSKTLNLPHFVFFYFWEGLVFGIAFIAHPQRKLKNRHLSKNDLLFGFLIGLGVWSIIMFINEIQLQWSIQSFTYITNNPIFWPVIPFAIIIMPISISYFFFNETNESNVLRTLFNLLVFTMLPLRDICVLPALISGIIFTVIHRKKGAVIIIIIAYMIMNLLTLLLNWQWII